MRVELLAPVVLGLALGVLVWPAAAVADPPDPDVMAVAQGNNAFALDLYRQLIGEPNQNVILSPYSVSSALAMTYAGARGATEAEMADTLHVALPRDSFHAAFGRLTSGLDPGGPLAGHELRVVNRLWGQQDYAFFPDFLQTTGDNYGAEMGRLDFLGDPDAARQTINHWVQEQTRDKIQGLLPPGSVDFWTRLVLTNAVYFRGDWKSTFDTDLTKNGVFLTETGPSSLVPLMYQQGTLPYAEEVAYPGLPDCQALRMPYADSNLSMLVLLPGETLDGLEASLTADSLAACVDALAPTFLDVYLPKFTVECEFNLNDPLAALGMVQAFDPAAADFSGITDENALYIQNVVHKAVIGVTEAGTEAAAATGVVMGFTSMPPQFRADHPFLYFILDDETGSILFMGRVANPTYSLAAVATPGDANGDGAVDDQDASILAANWQRTGDAVWQTGDFNGDANVNDLDASILAANWQHGVGSSAVPEPSTLALLAALAATASLLPGQRTPRGRPLPRSAGVSPAGNA